MGCNIESPINNVLGRWGCWVRLEPLAFTGISALMYGPSEDSPGYMDVTRTGISFPDVLPSRLGLSFC